MRCLAGLVVGVWSGGWCVVVGPIGRRIVVQVPPMGSVEVSNRVLVVDEILGKSWELMNRS